MKRYKGFTASPGLVLGQVSRLERPPLVFGEGPFHPEQEKQALEDAIQLAQKELNDMADRAAPTEQAIFLFQSMMLEDEGFMNEVNFQIRAGVGAAEAMDRVGRRYAAQLSAMKDNAYMQLRSVDILDVTQRITNILCRRPRSWLALDHPVIIASDLLMPTDLFSIPSGRILGLITAEGSGQSHAAIIARELGIPAVVGCGDATERLCENDEVTVSCAEGDTGNIYEGIQEVAVEEVQRGALPEIPVKVMMNVGNPQLAFEFQAIPNKGVGLARLEFIINNNIGIHPKVVLEYPNVPSELRDAAERLSAGYASPKEFFEKRIAEGVATIAAAFYPKKVIVRMSDFKSNEYRKLIGGALYEPDEENPMLGFRGASRYISNQFAECFAMECRAMKFVRDEMGLTNVELMIPFVRTLNEAKRVNEIMEQYGLKRGVNGLRLNMMCEIPSNAVLADQFLEYFDGFSIGSNDMTQLALGLDRDSGLVAASFDERDPAVKALLAMAIKACRERGKYVGICGQGPSDHADFAAWLMEQGIESISLNPDTVVDTWRRLAVK